MGLCHRPGVFPPQGRRLRCLGLTSLRLTSLGLGSLGSAPLGLCVLLGSHTTLFCMQVAGGLGPRTKTSTLSLLIFI